MNSFLNYPTSPLPPPPSSHHSSPHPYHNSPQPSPSSSSSSSSSSSLPNEAFGPSHIPTIASLLQASLTHDPVLIRQTTSQISSYESHPGWRWCMLSIGLTPGYPDTVRTMAIVLFKKQIDNVFRRSWGPATISRDGGEKELLRRMLLHAHTGGGGDGSDGIAVQPMSDVLSGLIAVCISLIAKHDWPRDWSTGSESLFPRLLLGLQHSSTSIVTRSLYTLHQVLKQLQASRLLVSRAKFVTASAEIIPCLRSKYTQCQSDTMQAVMALVQSGGGAQPSQQFVDQITANAKLCRLYVKCLRRLVTYGIGDIHSSIETQTLFPFFLQQLNAMVRIFPSLSAMAESIATSSSSPSSLAASSLPFVDIMFESTLLLMRIVNETLEIHSLQFRSFFLPFVQFSMELLNHNTTLIQRESIDAESIESLLIASSPSPPSSSSASPSPPLPIASPASVSSVVASLGLFPCESVLEPLCIECMLYIQKVIISYKVKVLPTSSSGSGIAQLGVMGVGMRVRNADSTVNGAAAANDVAMSQINESMAATFTPALLQQLLNLLLTHYLVLQRDDMQSWLDTPEQFYNEERSGAGESEGDDGTGDDQTLVVMNSRADGGSHNQHEYKMRMVADPLVKIIIEKFPEVATPYLVQMLLQLLQTYPPSGEVTHQLNQPNMILLKESLYTALGYAYLEVPDHLLKFHNLTFDQFFRSILLPELSGTTISQRLIRRRVMWLLGEWVESIGDDTRIGVYSSIVVLLQENDLIVRMSAIDTLYKLLDNVHYEFDPEAGTGDDGEDVLDLTADNGGTASAGHELLMQHFTSHFSSILGLLFQILNVQLSECPTKHHVLIIISKMIGAMKSRLSQAENCMPLLLQQLPAVWLGCVASNQNLLRTAVLDVITKLVVALGCQSSSIHVQIILPMLSFVLESNRCGADTNFLVEQCLELWKYTLQNCVSYSQPLGDAFRLLLSESMFSQMGTNTNMLQLSMEIIESYVHLGRSEFMHAYASHISIIFNRLLLSSEHIRPSVVASNAISGGTTWLQSGGAHPSPSSNDADGIVTDKSIMMLMTVLEAITQIYPLEVPLVFHATFQFMLRAMVDAYEYAKLNEDEQSRHAVSMQNDQVLAHYCIVIGRLLMQNMEGTIQMLQKMSTSADGIRSTSSTSSFVTNGILSPSYTLSELITCIVSVTASKLDCIVHVFKKKVCVIGLVQLLPSGDASVLSQFRSLMGCVRRIEKELAQPGAFADQPDWGPALSTPPNQRLERHRIMLMIKDDPSNDISVRQLFLDKLRMLSQNIGAANVEQMLMTADPMVWGQIRDGTIR